MGGYHGPNSDCYHCQGCGTYRPCDDCDVCQTNMNEHRELRRLENEFLDKVSTARTKTKEKCISVVDNLKSLYNINIIYASSYFSLYEPNNIINALKEKKEELKRNDAFLEKNNEIIQKKKEKIKELDADHKREMYRIRKEFVLQNEEIKKKKSPEFVKYREEKKEKEKIIEDLNSEKREILNEIEEIRKYFDDFRMRKQLELDEKLNEEKKKIDSKYIYIETIEEPILEYTEKEKRLKNCLEDNIRKIKNYSKIMPNYEFSIAYFGIKEYL